MYKGLFEASIKTVDLNGEPVVPYYDQQTLNLYVDDYVKENIKKYVKDYTIDINYQDKDSYEVCTFECRAVKITLKAKINVLFKYEKSQSFIVYSKDEL